MTEGPNPAFIAMGDLHLDEFIWRAHRRITGDACAAFEELVDLAADWYVPLVLLGDVFDSADPDPLLVEFFRRQMDRCREEGVKVYFIQGNHDQRAMAWGSATHDWPIWVGHGQQFNDISGINIVGFDYAQRDRIAHSIDDLAEHADGVQIVLLHQAVKQALRFEGKWNCDLEWIPPNIPLVLMGDIHKPMDIKFGNNQLGVYTGASHPRDVTQLGPKSCVLVYDDCSYERLPLTSREIRKFKVTADDEMRAVETWITEKGEVDARLPAVAWVVHVPAYKAEVARLRAEARKVLVIADPIPAPEEMDIEFDDEGDVVIEHDTEGLLSIDDLLRQEIDPDKEPEAYNLVLALLDARVSAQEVIRERREIFMTPSTEE